MMMNHGFTVMTRAIDACMAVVELRGEMDVYSAPRAKDVMAGLLAQGICLLIIDLRQLEYIDSTGLGMLIGILRRVREQGGGIRLVAPHHRVRRLLEITRLTYSFTIEHTEQEAITSLHEDHPALRQRAA